MNLENQKKLFEKHFLLRDSGIDYPTPFSMFYIECGDGWTNLLDELLTKIEEEILKDEPNYLNKNFPARNKMVVTQIKEKYGTLRFYVSYASEKILEIVDEYEIKSSSFCENCGKPGKLSIINGWYATFCDEHLKEKEGDS